MLSKSSTQKVLVDSCGLWNVSDEDVFKENVDKKFLELSAWEKEQYRSPFLTGAPPKFNYLFFRAATSAA